MCMGGSSAAGDARAQQQSQQQQIEGATNQINQAFSGFNAPFYQQRTQAYENYAEPQLQQQYKGTLQNLYGKLANQGLLNSSAATQEKGALKGELNTQQQGVANQGFAQSQSLQQQIAQEQQNLIGQANAATDPQSVARGALDVAGSFSTPSAFQPLGQLFQGFANTYLGSQLNSAYNPQLNSFLLGGQGGQKGGFGANLGAPASYG